MINSDTSLPYKLRKKTDNSLYSVSFSTEDILTHFRPMLHLRTNQVVGFTSKLFEKQLRKSDILSKNVTLPQVFLKYFASKNQLPGFYIGETLVENGLKINNLDSNKSHGHDEVSIRMVKSFVCRPLQIIYKPCLDRRMFPKRVEINLLSQYITKMINSW